MREVHNHSAFGSQSPRIYGEKVHAITPEKQNNIVC